MVSVFDMLKYFMFNLQYPPPPRARAPPLYYIFIISSSICFEYFPTRFCHAHTHARTHALTGVYRLCSAGLQCLYGLCTVGTNRAQPVFPFESTKLWPTLADNRNFQFTLLSLICHIITTGDRGFLTIPLAHKIVQSIVITEFSGITDRVIVLYLSKTGSVQETRVHREPTYFFIALHCSTIFMGCKLLFLRGLLGSGV